MKTKFLSVMTVVAVVLCTGYHISMNQDKELLSDLALANVEALADSNEAEGGNSVTCYSSSKASSGSTYYDCGGCTKQFNSKGTGDSSTCKTK